MQSFSDWNPWHAASENQRRRWRPTPEHCPVTRTPLGITRRFSQLPVLELLRFIILPGGLKPFCVPTTGSGSSDALPHVHRHRKHATQNDAGRATRGVKGRSSDMPWDLCGKMHTCRKIGARLGVFVVSLGLDAYM